MRYLCIFLLVLASVLPACAVSVNWITNGDFENDLAGWTTGVINDDPSIMLPQVFSNETPLVIHDWLGVDMGVSTATPYSGKAVGWAISGEVGSSSNIVWNYISQTITVPPGTYTVADASWMALAYAGTNFTTAAMFLMRVDDQVDAFYDGAVEQYTFRATKWDFQSVGWTPKTVATGSSFTTTTGKVQFILAWQNNDPDRKWNPGENGYAAFDNVVFTTNEEIPTPEPGGKISGALKLPDNADVTLNAKLVTTRHNAFPGAIYLEELDRSAAIRVATTEVQLQGDKVNVSGKMSTTPDGERVIVDSTVGFVSEGNTLPDPLCLTGRDLGGQGFGNYTPGVYQGKGLYNVGKLAVISGKVTYRGTGFFYLDDGSGLYDGNGEVTATGVRIDTTNMTNPAQNNAVVTGITTMKKIGDNSVRMLRPLKSGDIVGY